MEVNVARTAGFCFGVDRAVKLVNCLLDNGKKVCTLGSIIHNKYVVSELKKRGVIILIRSNNIVILFKILKINF